jgi:hypothetical protein
LIYSPQLRTFNVGTLEQARVMTGRTKMAKKTSSFFIVFSFM